MPHGGPHKLSQRQIVCSIVPEDEMSPSWGEFLFAQVSGGEITAAVEKVYAGGDQFPTVLCAPYEIGDITSQPTWTTKKNRARSLVLVVPVLP
jgi:hypothetical protein